MNNIPNHCQKSDRKGKGPIYFNQTKRAVLIINGGNEEEFQNGAHIFRFLHEVKIEEGSELKSLPFIAAFEDVKSLTIRSSKFTDWQSIYRIPSLEKLTIAGEAKGKLPSGIAKLRRLKTFEFRAPGISGLPDDLKDHLPTQINVDDNLKERIQAHVHPQMKVCEAGWVFTPIDLVVKQGNSLPSENPLDIRKLTITSPDFRDWPAVYALKNLQQLEIRGKASGELPTGIAVLKHLQYLKVIAKNISDLPDDLGDLPHINLETETLFHKGLRPKLALLKAIQCATRLPTLFSRLEVWLKENALSYLENLRPGLNEEEIRRIEEANKITLPPTLRALYRWRNGCRVPDARFVFWRDFLSLEEAIEDWKMLNAMNEAKEWAVNGKQPPGVWSPNWFPAFSYDNGFRLCVDLIGSYKGHRGQMIEVWLKDKDRSVLSPDLNTWLLVFIENVEKGEIAFDVDAGQWDFDLGKYRSVSYKLHPYKKQKTIRVRP